MLTRLRSKLSYANVAATLALVLTAGGAAFAATGGIPGKDGTIHGCYLKKSGSLRVVARPKCRKGERALKWNVRGPAGPQGERGLQGEQGVQGNQGVQGVQGQQGVPGTPATKLWAVVDADGTLAFGSGVSHIEHTAPGAYLVYFGRDVSGCSAVANRGGRPTNIAGQFTATPDGWITLHTQAAGSVQVYADGFAADSGDAVGVSSVRSSDKTLADSGFHLAVFC